MLSGVDRRVRLVEVLGVLSLACDAADGFAHETTLRSAVLAASLAGEVGDDRLVADVVVGALLRHIGRTSFSVEEAHRYGAGDDVALRSVMAEVDFGRPEVAGAIVSTRLAAHAADHDRDQAVGALLGDGLDAARRHDAAQCDAAERLGALLPVSEAARSVATDAFERWDGAGGPAAKGGDDISIVARIVEVGYVAELFRSRQGRGGALAELRARAGGHLDPGLVERFVGLAPGLFAGNDDPGRSAWDRLLDAEPVPHAYVSPSQVDQAALAFGRFSDLKSTWFAGHAEAVATTADAIAAELGLADPDRTMLRQAALLHDVGRVGVPTGIWDVPRALSGHERDRVNFHAWETARILGATPLFADVAQVAAATHERTDGSGYHRGLAGSSLDVPARVLAVADVWCALRSNRPHRSALDETAARAHLTTSVAAGELDRSAAAALLDTIGARALPRPTWPSGLTDREVEVLRLVASGSSSKAVAADLGITTRTVAHHIEHVYDKIGVRSRAGATLFALEHGLC